MEYLGLSCSNNCGNVCKKYTHHSIRTSHCPGWRIGLGPLRRRHHAAGAGSATNSTRSGWPILSAPSLPSSSRARARVGVMGQSPRPPVTASRTQAIICEKRKGFAASTQRRPIRAAAARGRLYATRTTTKTWTTMKVMTASEPCLRGHRLVPRIV